MTDRRNTIAVDLGGNSCRMCMCGQGVVQTDVLTPEALRASMTEEGGEVRARTVKVFLNKLAINTMFCNVEGTGFIVTHNTLCRESLKEALALAMPSSVLVNAQACALAACGSVTGIVLDIGYSEVRCVPVVEGTIVDAHCSFSSSLSARLVYRGFRKRFEELNKGVECLPVYLERHGRVSLDGTEIISEVGCGAGTLKIPCSAGYDALFDGSEPSADGCTLQAMLLSVLTSSCTVNRRALASCIVISGAVASAPGFASRLEQHLAHPTFKTLNARVVRPSFSPKYLSIIGASAMKSVPQLL
eukprot:TRINITY_DN7138_c0_g1_i8.p1 TRINITY_DN7138_c0_g1~~TRINITY_DN7138_c0_g1_i8.p1  ORF type:complete len:313 (+),score=75.44 TRINITY_DN7138_c0_g1_i8:34-939(+)